MIYITPVDGCSYKGLDSEGDRIVFNCSSIPEQMYYRLEKVEIKNKNHVDNLPTKCPKEIDDIQKNIAFWVYLLLFVVMIALNILFLMFYKGKDVLNYEIEVSKVDFNQVVKTENVQTEINENNPIKTNSIKINIDKKSFKTILANNFKALHPILLPNSIFTPKLFSIWILFFNIFNLFGFNALYFNETMLEDRIYDKHRDNFGYPMKTEFEKIMSAIATCIVLTLIVRLITLISYSEKTQLVSQLQEANNKEEIINSFNKTIMIRRIIAGVFMLVMNIFFFYYCIVFCGIYINAQYGWLYSGIWALLFNWIAYAPIYIVIISLIENAGFNSCTYYMKRLFHF